MPLTRDVRRVMVGDGALFVGPEDEAPVEDTVGLFEGWPDPYIHPGLTNEGVNSSFERDLTFHRVEEQSAPVRVTVNESTLSLATAFAEDTLENYKLAVGGGLLAKIAAAVGQIGKTTYRPSDDIETVSIGFESKNSFGHWRRMHLPRCVATASVEQSNRRSESKRLYNGTFQSISAMEDISIVDKTANALAGP